MVGGMSACRRRVDPESRNNWFKRAASRHEITEAFYHGLKMKNEHESTDTTRIHNEHERTEDTENFETNTK